MGLSAESKARAERWRTVEEQIWEKRRSRLTKEEFALAEQRSAILHEASRGQTSIAEAIWRGRAALQAFEAKRREGKNE